MSCSYVFFFNDTPTTEIYTFPYTTLFRSHRGPPEGGDPHPPQPRGEPGAARPGRPGRTGRPCAHGAAVLPHLRQDRKSTRLNSSHPSISYAVFCLKKKNTKKNTRLRKKHD